MTKEELEKEAEEWVKEKNKEKGFGHFPIDCVEAYVAGAEPREKQMTKEKHNCDNVNCNHNDTKGLCCLFNPDNCKYRQLQKENAELKRTKEGKVVEHFEAYGQCRDSRRIAELEAENERLTVSYETLKLHDEEEIGMLKSENAELKVSCKIQVDTAFQMIYEKDEQLTKAKEIIKKMIEAIHIWDCKNLEEVEAEAEQFLKDSEVEK